MSRTVLFSLSLDLSLGVCCFALGLGFEDQCPDLELGLVGSFSTKVDKTDKFGFMCTLCNVWVTFA